MNKEYKKNLKQNKSLSDRCKPRQVIRPEKTATSATKIDLFVGKSNRPVSDVVLANLIVVAAVMLAAFIPVVSIALPFLVFLYLEIGLWGFVYTKEMGGVSKYEDLFVSLKKYAKIFCMAMIKLFLFAFWSVFLIVPGVIFLLNYAFTSLILFESDLDVRGALVLSKELTHGFRCQMMFWALLATASVCSAMTLAFFVVMFIDVFATVSSTVYILTVISIGMLDLLTLALPMVELAVTDCYILAKERAQEVNFA